MTDEQNWPKFTVLNVNIPTIINNIENGNIRKYDEIKGIIVASPGHGCHKFTYELENCEKEANNGINILCVK